MRVLLAITESCNPQATSEYVAARFDGTAVELDVLSVVPRPSSPVDRLYIPSRTAAETRAANDLVTTVAKRLDEHHGFRRVRTHVQRGVVADTILATSERRRSAAVLIGAPREGGLLTALGIDSVASAVSARAPCSVELLRASSIDVDRGNRVLAIVDINRLDSFPFDQLQLQSLSWKSGSLLRILCVLPLAIDGSRAEISPATALRELNEGIEGRRWAAARLDAVCRELRESFGKRIVLDYRLIAGHTRDIALESAKRLSASLLVLDSAATDSALKGLFSSFSPTAITMAAPCSVLLLHPDVPLRHFANAEAGSRLEPFPRS